MKTIRRYQRTTTAMPTDTQRSFACRVDELATQLRADTRTRWPYHVVTCEAIFSEDLTQAVVMCCVIEDEEQEDHEDG